MTDKITKAARGRECEIRLPGVCNGDTATTVFCHFRPIGISGFGYKTPAPIGAFGCSSCHAVVDTTKDAEIQLAFAHGVMRTINTLWQEGVIKK